MDSSKKLAQIGGISVRLEQFTEQLEALRIYPQRERAKNLIKEVIDYASSRDFAQNAVRGHKETVGNLLIGILEVQDAFDK